MPTQRDLLSAHGAGKGDKERSSDWRKNYDSIDWSGSVSGFVQDGAKQVKTYGGQPVRGIVHCPVHGNVNMSFAEWHRQVYVDMVGSFECPKCGMAATLVQSIE